jgi:nucleotide-binding universal stress UspA family protein
MSASIVVLTSPHVSASLATDYAIQLGNTLGASVRLLPTGPLPDWTGPPEHVLAPRQLPTGAAALAQYPPQSTLAATAAIRQALVVVVPRPSPTGLSAWLTNNVLALLQANSPPVLVLPPQAAGRVPPLRIALAADGDAFELTHRHSMMQALLFTLPIHLHVVHVPGPNEPFSGFDALQTFSTCGLAPRTVFAELSEVPASSPAAGILLGVQQAHADLLVLIVRRRSLWQPHFAQGVTASLLWQSPVPVLLLAAEG